MQRHSLCKHGRLHVYVLKGHTGMLTLLRLMREVTASRSSGVRKAALAGDSTRLRRIQSPSSTVGAPSHRNSLRDSCIQPVSAGPLTWQLPPYRTASYSEASWQLHSHESTLAGSGGRLRCVQSGALQQAAQLQVKPKCKCWAHHCQPCRPQ